MVLDERIPVIKISKAKANDKSKTLTHVLSQCADVLPKQILPKQIVIWEAYERNFHFITGNSDDDFRDICSLIGNQNTCFNRSDCACSTKRFPVPDFND